MTPDLQSQVALWRAKIADGSITKEEMKEAVIHLRQGRLAAAQASTTAKRAKAKAEIPNADDLLSELENGL